MLRLSCYPCCLSPLNRFLINMIWHILFYLYWRWVWDFDMMFKDMGLVIRVMCLMIRFVMWILMGSVRGWFLDDRITGNAWFLLVKLGWSGCLVLNILYGFFKDFKWVRRKVDFTRVWEVFWSYFWWFLAI